MEDGRHETELERTDRQLGELLQELRVAQTGVQVSHRLAGPHEPRGVGWRPG